MWIANSHKLPKKGPIRLKFAPSMYFYVFIKFQRIFEKFRKLADFWPRNGDFSRFSRCDFGTTFSPEKNRSQRQKVGMSWFLVQKLFVGSATKLRSWILLILSFWRNMAPFMSQKGLFLRLRRIFCEKWPFGSFWQFVFDFYCFPAKK